jgi:L-fucose mutarotase/ribose pyranase (RbsD/FucU family)
MNNWNFIKSSAFFRIIILIILLLFNISYAQQQEPVIKDQAVTIVLGNGAKMYSSDESFNSQIVHKKIIIKNANLSLKKLNNAGVLTVSSLSNVKNQNLAQQLKISEDQKRKEVLKKIKEKIDTYEAKSKAFEKQNYQSYPSPSQFFSSYATSKNYITPNHNVHDFSKIYAEAKDYSVKRALDYLHTQQFTFYNNKSLDFCFSKVFSVRPPPILGVF